MCNLSLWYVFSFPHNVNTRSIEERRSGSILWQRGRKPKKVVLAEQITILSFIYKYGIHPLFGIFVVAHSLFVIQVLLRLGHRQPRPRITKQTFPNSGRWFFFFMYLFFHLVYITPLFKNTLVNSGLDRELKGLVTCQKRRHCIQNTILKCLAMHRKTRRGDM